MKLAERVSSGGSVSTTFTSYAVALPPFTIVTTYWGVSPKAGGSLAALPGVTLASTMVAVSAGSIGVMAAVEAVSDSWPPVSPFA